MPAVASRREAEEIASIVKKSMVLGFYPKWVTCEDVIAGGTKLV